MKILSSESSKSVCFYAGSEVGEASIHARVWFAMETKTKSDKCCLFLAISTLNGLVNVHERLYFISSCLASSGRFTLVLVTLDDLQLGLHVLVRH